MYNYSLSRQETQYMASLVGPIWETCQWRVSTKEKQWKLEVSTVLSEHKGLAYAFFALATIALNASG